MFFACAMASKATDEKRSAMKQPKLSVQLCPLPNNGWPKFGKIKMFRWPSLTAHKNPCISQSFLHRYLFLLSGFPGNIEYITFKYDYIKRYPGTKCAGHAKFVSDFSVSKIPK